MSELKNRMKGFTIIEVVLVLAIAGLIFLMVFIALPALQGNQRDSQRRSDMGRLTSQISSYQTNNRGDVPTTAQLAGFVSSYMRPTSGGTAEKFTDPGGTDYNVQAGNNTNDDEDLSFNTTAPNVYYFPGRTCTGEDATASSARKVAFRMALERGGTACFTNQ